MTVANVDAYINQFGGEVKKRLEVMRLLIRTTAPQANESIAYGMPAYKLNGKPLAYFAGYENHIGFYATPNGHEAFAEEFAKYKQGKGSVQFPNDQPLPIDLIKRVVIYRKDEMPYIGKPAASALAAIGVTKASQLKDFTEEDLLVIHGIGPKAIRILRDAGVIFKEG